jgi:tetratricopeptide (TPR) repeat protein
MSGKNTKKNGEPTPSFEKLCRSSSLIETLHGVIESHQDEDVRSCGMAILYLLDNKHQQSLECLQSLAGSYPQVGIFQRRSGEIMISLRRYEEAILLFEKAAKLDKDDYTSRFWLALCYYETAKPSEGKHIFEELKESVFLLNATNNNWLK